MALTLVTSDLIHGLDYSKLTGTIPTWNQNTTGNADTATLAAGATILATARNIGGVSFNGSAAINLPGVNTAGNQNTSGNAGTVTNGVYTVGDQTIGGVKTFSSNIIVGDGHFIGDDSFDNLLLQSSSGENLNVSSANDVIFYTGGTSPSSLGTQRLRIFNSSGNATFSGSVALGGATVANDYLLEISSVSSGNIMRSTRGSSQFSMYQSNNSDVYMGTTSNNRLRFLQNDGDALTIDTNKNIGIGTTSPSHKLSVKQNSYASGSDAPEAALGITIGDYWTTTAGAALTIKNAGHRGAVGHASGSPLFRADFNNATGMILDKNGNVGIGTASPVGLGGNAKALVVTATSNYPEIIVERLSTGAGKWGMLIGNDSTLLFRNYVSGGNVLCISNSDKVGIGTASPSAKLDVQGTTGTRNFNTTSGQTSSIYETSRYYSAAGSTTTNVAIVTTTAFPTMGGGGYLMVEVSASGYGNGGTNGLVFSWIGGGYGGHYGTPGSLSYHPVEIIADTHHSSCNVSVYYPNYNTVGITIVNSSGTGMTGVMRVKVTTSY